MRLQIIGLNHTTAPVEIREQVVFAGDQAGRALAHLKSLPGVDELVLLSTCNRTEFYAIADDDGVAGIEAWLHDGHNLAEGLADCLFRRDQDAAIRHVFRVACGLDSMVLGEPQILGQLKDAVRDADQAKTLGTHLHRLFQHSYSVAKKVRTDTEIGASPVSVASAAVTLAQQFYAGFEKHTAVLVGAGTTIDLVARHLVGKNIGRLFVANRDLDRAKRLASAHDGYAVPLSELEGTLPEADILVSSTASESIILSGDQLQAASVARKRRPIVAIDIAVPRDIDPEAGKLDDVYLFGIDDLDKVVLEGQENRESAAVDAERILNDELNRYLAMQRAREANPVISALRDHGQAIHDEVMIEARRRLAKGADSAEVVEFATASMMKKLLHHPSVKLREASEANEQSVIDATRKLFDLDPDDDQ